SGAGRSGLSVDANAASATWQTGSSRQLRRQARSSRLLPSRCLGSPARFGWLSAVSCSARDSCPRGWRASLVWVHPADRSGWSQLGRDGPLADLRGQGDDDASGAPEVAEPVAVVVLCPLAEALGSVAAQ